MAKEDEKVKVELEMPKDQVSVHAASEVVAEISKDEKSGEDNKEELVERQEKAIEVLKETRRELSATKKEVKELKEKVEDSDIDEGTGSPVKQATGYDLGEIIGAPISPPEPEAKGKPKLSQLRLVLTGFIIVFVGLVLWPIFTFAVGMSIAITGAVFVAVGVLVRL